MSNSTAKLKMLIYKSIYIIMGFEMNKYCNEIFIVSRVLFGIPCFTVVPLIKAFVGKTYTIHQKYAKTTKLLSLIVFVIYGK